MVLLRGKLTCYETIQLSEANRYEITTMMTMVLLSYHAKAGRYSEAFKHEGDER